MLSILKKIFGGTKHEKDVKALRPVITQINEEYAQLHSVTDEQLRIKTDEFKAYIQSKIEERINNKLEKIYTVFELRNLYLAHQLRIAVPPVATVF